MHGTNIYKPVVRTSGYFSRSLVLISDTKPAIFQMLRELQSQMYCLLTIIQSHIIVVVSGDGTLGLHSYQWLHNCVSMVTIEVTMLRTELVLWDTSYPITAVTHEKKMKFELDCEWRHTHFKLTTKENESAHVYSRSLSLFLSLSSHTHVYILTYIHIWKCNFCP
jgi:hypothetical protein